MVWTKRSALVLRMSATMVMVLLLVLRERCCPARPLVDKQTCRMLEHLAQALHEGRGQRAVDDAVVERRRQVHQRPRDDGAVAITGASRCGAPTMRPRGGDDRRAAIPTSLPRMVSVSSRRSLSRNSVRRARVGQAATSTAWQQIERARVGAARHHQAARLGGCPVHGVWSVRTRLRRRSGVDLRTVADRSTIARTRSTGQVTRACRPTWS